MHSKVTLGTRYANAYGDEASFAAEGNAWMSIRRTQQTVETLWRALEMRGIDPATPQRDDPESGEVKFQYKGKPCKHDPSMNPPRLRGQGCCSKLVLLLLCSMCCTVVVIGFLALLNLPIVSETRAALHQHLAGEAAGDASSGSGVSARRKPLPAILRRFSMIKRARAPERGADRSTLDAAFPHWKEGPQVALGDVALALSAVVEQIEPNSEARTPSFSTRQNSRSEEDTNTSDL